MINTKWCICQWPRHQQGSKMLYLIWSSCSQVTLHYWIIVFSSHLVFLSPIFLDFHKTRSAVESVLINTEALCLLWVGPRPPPTLCSERAPHTSYRWQVLGTGSCGGPAVLCSHEQKIVSLSTSFWRDPTPWNRLQPGPSCRAVGYHLKFEIALTPPCSVNLNQFL